MRQCGRIANLLIVTCIQEKAQLGDYIWIETGTSGDYCHMSDLDTCTVSALLRVASFHVSRLRYGNDVITRNGSDVITSLP